ncbi:aldo/keto reductase [Verrucomicrobium sp. BvORR034]|uniref:aldo/keto reductase n=1 Tax=Verrucomicrobium sp. BvORR034 TaxID=1396418 RepID=UPI000678FA7B|nr:aldo/keto reductase [Verrucomicrobium sp. BvORR034]
MALNTLPAAHRIGLGTYQLGSRTYEVCRSALDLGYRHLDTATLYRNEEAVSRAVADCGIPRCEVFVVSKILSRDVAVPARVLSAARETVERLGQVDLLLLHAPAGEWLRAWELLQEAAAWPEVGAVGVSNFDIRHLEGLVERGLPLPSWNQIEVSPFLPRTALVQWCQGHGVQIAAHSPLVKGQRLDHPVLKEVAARHEATSAQVLIAWSLAQGLAVLPRSSQTPHLAENLAAQQFQLTQSDLQDLSTLEDGFATHPQHVPPEG